MRLLLDPLDLKPEYQRANLDQAISTFQVTFDTLNERAQRAVRAVGKAVFHSWDGTTYNAVYAPKEDDNG